MGKFRDVRRLSAHSVRLGRKRAACSRPSVRSRIASADRRALLLGTALASSLIVLPVMTSPAAAQVTCPGGNAPIAIGSVGPINQPIVCENANERTNNAGDAINLQTTGADNYITVDNSGDLTAINNAGDAAGIYTDTSGNNSPILIVNSGDISAVASVDAYGIYAITQDPFSTATIINSGNLTVSGGEEGFGIYVRTIDDDNAIIVNNIGAITVTSPENAYGIYALTLDDNSPISVNNGGIITVTTGDDGFGIRAQSIRPNSPISIMNSGDITVAAGSDGIGIDARSSDTNNPISITNSGNILVKGLTDEAYGIFASSNYDFSPITIMNSGNITAIALTAADSADAIDLRTYDNDSAIVVTNSATLRAQATLDADGIDAETNGDRSGITIINSGDIYAAGASIETADGLELYTENPDSPIRVFNSGAIGGEDIGIFSESQSSTTTITNLATGRIFAGSGLAIDVEGGAGSIFNAGLITGFVDLTDNGDYFENQQGGLFQAQGTSLFGMGNDLFTNQVGGVVDTANNPLANEMVSFQGLETFQNFGTISLVDGAPGDLFTIANTPMMTDLNYVAGSFLAVDAFLGGPGSSSDIFRIDGNVGGVTDVIVNNTNPLPGTFNPVGLTVVQVRGNVDPSAFRLANGPIDTGFFNFDLFFEPGTPFDQFELRSFPGAGAQLLPQLVTAAQDIWHQTSDTWFDRSADLRTQLWRGGGSVPGVPGAMYLGGGSAKDGAAVEQGGLSPAVWARVSHGELEQDGSARTNAFGRSFNFNLDRELYIIDVQSGVDFAVKGVMNPSDVLLLSVFGGGVSANLQYDQLDRRRFDYDGGQVGVAATYLSGGLFVDALFNAQFLEVDPNAPGFSQNFDSNSYGFRIDSGYRFGMGSGGLFLEPLLTLAYVNSDLDGFSFAGNTVSFQDEDSLRGRVGLRAGTSLFIENVRFEPFVIASYWGELSDDDNQATLVSSGTRFGFRDAREDGWGEVSLGTNTFLAGNNALSAFSKIDIIFGDDTEGYIAQGGFRVQW